MIATTITGRTIMSECCYAPSRWLDCAECEETGETCQLVVCTNCGDTVDETSCTETL